MSDKVQMALAFSIGYALCVVYGIAWIIQKLRKKMNKERVKEERICANCKHIKYTEIAKLYNKNGRDAYCGHDNNEVLWVDEFFFTCGYFEEKEKENEIS